MSKRFEAISPPPHASPGHWLGFAWSNVLLLAVLIGAVWLGHSLEFQEHSFRVWLFRGRSFVWHWGSSETVGHSRDARNYCLAAIAVIMAVSLQLINGISGQFSLGHAGFMAIGAYLSGYACSTFGALDPADESTNFQNVGPVLLYYLAIVLVVALAGAAIAILFLLFRWSRQLSRALPPLLLLALVAWFIWDFTVAFNLEAVPDRYIWTKGVRGLSALFTWTLAHGMAPARSFSLLLPAILRRPLCFVVLLAGGGLFAAAAGLLVGLPTMRLRGDYLAIATLGFAEILRVIFTNSQAMGGATGLSVAPYWNAGDPDHDPVTHYLLPWILALMVITVAAVWRVAYSPRGRLIRAVREDEIAAAAVGINNTRQKVTAFIIGAFFAGIGGALYVQVDGYVNPGSFGIDQSLLYVVMVTLGGLGSISGAILAAFGLTILSFKLRDLAEPSALSSGLNAISSQTALPHFVRNAAANPGLLDFLHRWLSNQNALFALILIAVMLLRPRGLLGGREIWFRRRVRSPAPVTARISQ